MTSRRAVQYAHDQPCTHQLLFRLVFFKSNLLINTEAHAQLFNLSAGGPSGSLHNSYSAAVQLFFFYYFFILSHLVSGPISSWRCSNFPSQYFNVVLGSPWHQRGERRPQQLPSGMCLSANDAPSTESERLPLRWPPDRLEPS